MAARRPRKRPSTISPASRHFGGANDRSATGAGRTRTARRRRRPTPEAASSAAVPSRFPATHRMPLNAIENLQELRPRRSPRDSRPPDMEPVNCCNCSRSSREVAQACDAEFRTEVALGRVGEAMAQLPPVLVGITSRASGQEVWIRLPRPAASALSGVRASQDAPNRPRTPGHDGRGRRSRGDRATACRSTCTGASRGAPRTRWRSKHGTH